VGVVEHERYATAPNARTYLLQPRLLRILVFLRFLGLSTERLACELRKSKQNGSVFEVIGEMEVTTYFELE
jgi:hypothetical protein